jgi:hypothetical protein
MVKGRTRLGMNPEIELNQGIHEHWLKGTSNNDDFFVRSIAGAAGR